MLGYIVEVTFTPVIQLDWPQSGLVQVWKVWFVFRTLEGMGHQAADLRSIF